MKLLAIIPARSGSKGIPKKNLAPLAGKPLIAWTLEAALAAKALDRVVVSTDSEEIAAVARDYGAETPFLRPAALAQDSTPTLDVLQHCVAELEKLDGYRADAVVTLQPTSPVRTAVHIDTAAAVFAADANADSLVSCIEVPHIFHPLSVMKRQDDGYLAPFLELPQPARRQEKPTLFARNGAAIYITRTSRLSQYVFGGNLIGFPMEESASIDIDAPDDLAAAERALFGNRAP